MLGRVSRSADFERALGLPACARSAHFAVHFVPEGTAKGLADSSVTKLSTVDEQACSQPVDDSASSLPVVQAHTGPARVLLGAVVPKRHARRSVTRTLLKRQIRCAASRRAAPQLAAALPAGIWVVRLRAPFDRSQYVSAASDALRSAARAELDAVFESAQRRLGQAPAR